MRRRRRRLEEVTQLGRRYGKPDLDRIGFFDDIPNGPFDSYSPPTEIRQNVVKGRQLFPGPPLELFEKEFKRIFVGEALPKSWHPISQVKNKKIKIVKGPPLLPPSPSKKHSTPGDSYGCFGKPTYFSPELRAEPKRKRKRGEPDRGEPANFKIKPGKLGGPGYADICFSPYPTYSHEPYDPEERKDKRRRKEEKTRPSFVSTSSPLDHFPPNPYYDERPGPTYVRPKEIQPKILATGPIYVPFPKSPGGNHDGCFSKFPSYSSEPYDLEIPRVLIAGPPLIAGGPDLRTKYTKSIINQVTAVSCNAKNYREYSERVYPLTG
ncbi:PREDICTED: UPF0602 protein C4orf47 homolog [Polistes canadensis]|uniref:UPF0602 protein C4orf47 homolog n=1 Tax=Polistes canadensis TaxID=91411 RepID=UPI000718F503|nr:PREDICTED: UPF0602 protein C4orf47 homolog [Polistes canadensis]